MPPAQTSYRQSTRGRRPASSFDCRPRGPRHLRGTSRSGCKYSYSAWLRPILDTHACPGKRIEGQLLRTFRRHQNRPSVCNFDFWQGVDVARRALSCVTDSTSFLRCAHRPDRSRTPADSSKRTRARAFFDTACRSGDQFEAGRVAMIRSTTDRGRAGILVLVETKSFGRRFAKLPQCRVTSKIDDLRDICRQPCPSRDNAKRGCRLWLQNSCKI